MNKEFISKNFFFPYLSHEKFYRYNSGELKIFVFQFIVINFRKKFFIFLIPVLVSIPGSFNNSIIKRVNLFKN